MPPWNAIDTVECKPKRPWRFDERLTETELLLLQRWAAEGAPEGSRVTPMAADAPRTRGRLTDVHVALSAPEPYVLIGDSDEYRCFVLDPRFEEGKYVSAIDLVPSNREVAHHATVIVDSERKARVAPGGNFECMQDIVNGAVKEIHNWAPGMSALEFPENIGIYIPPRAWLILLVHYSPKGGASNADQTRVELKFASKRPDFVLETSAGLGGLRPDVRIPAGAKDHTETIPVPIPPPGRPSYGPGGARVFNIMGHAHLAATDIMAKLTKANGTDECLIEDRWNFHWQRRYAYDSPIDSLPLLEDGDTMTVRCTYDNTMDNRVLRNELLRRREGIADISPGPTTRDEMCHVTAQLVVPNTN